ncbi:MAG TPA: hypothetical protein VGS22_15665 [Thermoanaerobaculia bacterium]|jgi:hypothetical protein|nr:hypothetical protein [Thermoanaerobaculia bacterium]
MFRLRRLLGIALALAALAGQTAQAQAPAGQLYGVHREHANPARLAEYESTSREFAAAMKEHKISTFPSPYIVWSFDDLTYDYVAPMANLEDLAKVPTTFATLAGKMGEAKFGDLMSRANSSMLSWDDVVIRERPDLGYAPTNPRVSREETRVVRFDYYFLRPGTEGEIDQLAKDWRALATAKGIRDGYRIFESVVGPELPLLVVATPGRDAVDLATAWAANVKAGGAEWQALMARTLGLCRKFETKVGTWRGDLSAR